tara:strand:- start:41 stop:340 length:300 start_codon:yes stop_codon:yes gene_type:complete
VNIRIPVPPELESPEQVHEYLARTGWIGIPEESGIVYGKGDKGSPPQTMRACDWEVKVPYSRTRDWGLRRAEVLYALLQVGQLVISSSLAPAPKKAGDL